MAEIGRVARASIACSSRRPRNRGAANTIVQLSEIDQAGVMHSPPHSEMGNHIMNTTMASSGQTSIPPGPPPDVEAKIQQFRDLFADAPEIGKKALENALHELRSQTSALPPAVESAGRIGARLGKVSELTIIVPLAPGGAKRLRAFLKLLRGNLSQGADKVGTLHTMRFVFFDNDTRLLFATAYDGDWDAYIDDFVAKIPDYLDVIDSAWDGWPGIRSPGAKDYLVKHQITAEGWYVAYPDLTVAEIKRLQRIGKAVDEMLDKLGG
jgi:hypothetical protein